ncbi:MAG: hydantoinase/oxoprolinase family protein [Candidatus Sulfotelmatobacter sp.]
MAYRLAIDVGGTFTDLLLFNESSGELVLAKTPSTNADPSIGVLTGIHKVASLAGIDPNRVSLILHGTTVATNTVLEGKGARVGLITNRGFEQILHVARGQTPGPLAGWIIMIKPEPMAPLELTRGISARMSAAGEELTPLDENEARDVIRQLCTSGIEALTISLLNSYANSEHERKLKQIAEEIAGDLAVTASYEILPEFHEYERTLTTVMNSYVRPRMHLYLDGMQQRLKQAKLTARMEIVRSDGGVMSMKAASEHPVATLLSGPSGGAVASAYVGQLSGFANVLSFDMGGTSTDVALSRDGMPSVIRETRVGQYPVKVASVDVHSVGAGGGSIAHVPITGALRVGPMSSGADPGPACYGRGGSEPTVTDANVVLGYLPPELLNGEMKLDVTKAAAAVQKIADAMNLSLLEAAQGIYDIVNENMFGALRLVSVQRGYDPRDFALLALGGAGPLHANALSCLIGSWPAIIPTVPGVLSALGFLHADIKTEFSRTLIRPVTRVDLAAIRKNLDELEVQARAWLKSENIAAARQRIQFQFDMRYYRQGYEFAIDVQPEWFKSPSGMGRVVEKFKDVHHRNYAFNIDYEVEIVNLRAIAIGKVRKVELKRHAATKSSSESAQAGKRELYQRGQLITGTVYERSRLKPGHRIPGPAVITQADSTTLILPGHHGEVDPYLNILIWPNGRSGIHKKGSSAGAKSGTRKGRKRD